MTKTKTSRMLAAAFATTAIATAPAAELTYVDHDNVYVEIRGAPATR